MEVSEVRAMELPEFDEELLKSLQVETVEELKEKTKGELKGQKEYSSRMQIRQKLSQEFCDAITMQLPLSGLEANRENFLKTLMERKMQEGETQESLEEKKDELVAEASALAEKELKTQLVLDKISTEEKITAEQEDFNRAIMQQAYMSRTQPDKLIKELTKNKDQLNQLRLDIIRSKALDHIVENATAINKEEVTAAS